MKAGTTATRARPTSLPTGTVTFLITDIEGSTALVIELGEAFALVLERHYSILRAAVADGGGTTVSTSGDSVFAVFPTATGAAQAAVSAQRSLRAEPWPGGWEVRVRMGLHTGEGRLGGDDYVGLDVHRTARISAAAHGGQVLLSAATAALLSDGARLRDLGEHRLKDLVRPEHLYQLAAPGTAESFPPLRSGGGILTILPVPGTTFVARTEVDALAAVVSRERLVTLTGPGGTGKTRLAIEAARRVKQRFADGVVFVDLAPVDHPDLVATAVISTLGLESGSNPPHERLARYLSGRSMLLVLDNFEQVLDAAPLTVDLLAASDGLHLLVTSRAPLHVGGEQEFPVPPLDVPAATADGVQAVAASPAVRLFVDRASRVRPSFAVTPENAAALASIVTRLDGLPLAVELAAARVRLLPPAVIADRLESAGSGDLVARDRATPGRQRTLESVIGWSYDLLEPAAQVAFRRFAAFRGGARLEEIEPVLCRDGHDDVLGLLDALVEHSLLRQEEIDGDARFRMLVTIAEFAQTRLATSGEEVAARERHADAYLRLAEAAAPHLTGWDQRRWLDRLERDHDNLRVAVDRCVAAQDAGRSLRFAAALWRFWQIRGHLNEAAQRIEGALALTTSDVRLRARALEAAGGIAWWRGDMGYARRAYADALALLEPGDDLAATANARYNLALAMGFDGTDEAAQAQLVQARREAEQAHDPRVEAWAVWGLSDIGVARGDWGLAARSAEESLAMFRRLDDPFGIGWSLFMTATGDGRLQSGDRELARRRFHEGTRIFASFGDLTAITMHCWGLARIEAITGRPDRALRLIGASRALRERTGTGLLDVNEDMLAVFDGETTAALAARGYSDAEVDRLVREGMALSTDEAVAYILEELPA